MADNLKVKFTAETKQLTSGISKVAKELKTIGTTSNKSFGAAYTAIKKANGQIVNLNKDLNRSDKLMKGMGKGFGAFGAMLGIGSFYAIGNALTASIKSAVSAIETQNLFKVALAGSADEADRFVTNLSKVTGLDYSNLQNAVGSYALLAKSMGMSSDQAEILSTSTASMALDLASLTNVPVEQVMADLKSGLVGQSETVYKYGLDVTEAGLKAEAMAKGISKSVRNMSQGEKMALRYSIYVRKLTQDMGNGDAVVGDFARTINQPANQLKILGDQFITLGRSIGNIFLPLLGKVLPYINAIVSILIDGANAIAAFFGFDATDIPDVGKGLGLESVNEDLADTEDNAGSANNALKKMQKTMLGIDELNVMAKPTEAATGGTGGSGVGGASILDNIDLTGIEDMYKGISGVSDELKKKLLPTVQKIAVVVGIIGALFLAWKISGLVTAFAGLAPILQVLGGVALVVGGLVALFFGLKGILEENDLISKTLLLP